jgi:uncharacterized membrane protein (DUF2068 family)
MHKSRPVGVAAVSVFFAFGAVMAALAFTMLLFPGSELDRLWQLNPQAKPGLTALGASGVMLMAVVCATGATAAIGLWRCRWWGLWLAVGGLAVNLAADLGNAVIRHDWRTLVGLPIGGAIISYLIARRRVFTV